jgi:tRNA U34 5-methylaminomethyl-2-thiouridine-forming methyltransferase MnmC
VSGINDSKIIITNDGSNTLVSHYEREHYHSTHGAIAEAKHVYIDNGLRYFDIKNISILEMGFGTGLNTFLTFLNNQFDTIINYVSIENNPIDISLALKLNYVDELNATKFNDVFERIHSGKWNSEIFLSKNFSFVKKNIAIEDVEFEQKFDLVYYDAFGPRVQPELWTKDIFLKIYGAMNTNGILITYCAKGEVKRILQAIGFEIKALAGPPGKREITQAVKII